MTEERTKRTPEVAADLSVPLAPFEVPDQPSWERARALCREVRRGAEAIVQLGRELLALRRQWFSVGGRPPGKNSPQGAASFSSDSKTSTYEARRKIAGWQQKVREELGISDDTARRIMERAQAIISLRRLQNGELIEYQAPDGKAVIEPTPEARENAAKILEEVEAGTVSASRALAGLVGETLRRQRSPHRAPVDHAENIRVALIKLQNSLPKWGTLSPKQRAELEETWAEILPLLPDTWKWL